jgi:large conductance mechanosensitive channel
MSSKNNEPKELLKETVKKTGGLLSGFRDFALRGNAIDLAVGVVIGGAFTALVNSLVNSIINPFIAAIFGGTNMDGIWIVEIHGSAIKFGTFISSIINFVIIAAALYFFIILPLNKLLELTSAKKDEEEEPEDLPKTQEDILLEILETLKRQGKSKVIKH